MSLRVLHAAIGVGAGEAALGAELAREVCRDGGTVRALVNTPMNARLMEAAGAVVSRVDTAVTEPGRFDAVVVSSSLTCGRLLDLLPRLPTLATEHTWLPQRGDRVDRYAVFMSEEAWRQGLADGPYDPSEASYERCVPVGWAGSVPEVDSSATHRVVVYLGQPGLTVSAWDWRPHALAAVERLVLAGEIDALVVGDAIGLTLPPHLRWRPWLPPEAHGREVAGARLFVSHATAASMQVALLGGTPIVAFTEGRAFRHLPSDAGWADHEALTWARCGLHHHCPASQQAEPWIRYALSLPRPAPRRGGGGRRALELLEELVA